jgi:hypothetical protein
MVDNPAITQASPMVITVSLDPVTSANTYQIGMKVKLMIPVSYGMQQANGLIGKIIATGVNTLTLNIDSSGFDPFSIPALTAEMPASLAPAGSQNVSYDNSTQIAFKSLNNIGN